MSNETVIFVPKYGYVTVSGSYSHGTVTPNKGEFHVRSTEVSLYAQVRFLPDGTCGFATDITVQWVIGHRRETMSSSPIKTNLIEAIEQAVSSWYATPEGSETIRRNEIENQQSKINIARAAIGDLEQKLDAQEVVIREAQAAIDAISDKPIEPGHQV